MNITQIHKTIKSILGFSRVLPALAGLALLLPTTAQALDYVKANTPTMMNATDWSPTTPWPPSNADTLSWQSSPIALTNNLVLSLGMDFSVTKLDLRPNGTADLSLKIGSGNTINLGTGGANQSNGAWDSTLNCAINLVGDAAFNIQGDMVVNGSITQDATARRLTKSGSGALLLTGANSYAKGTVISSGILCLSGNGTLGSTTATTGILTLSGGGNGTTLDFGGTTQTIAGAVTFGGGEVRNGTLICNATGNAFNSFGVISANLQGTGNLWLDNGGHILKLSGTNTYSGTTTVQGGTILASKPTSLPNSGASGTFTLNSANNAMLAVRAGGTGEWGSSDIAVLLANATFTVAGTSAIGLGIDTTSGDFIYGNAIPNKANMSLQKLGPNTLTLSGANLYTRPTMINRGTVKLDNAAGGSLANSSGLTFNGTGTFNYNTASTSQSLGALTLSVGEGTVQLTRSSDAALTFSSLAARTAGATANLSLSGGTPSALNGFNLTGAALGFINQGLFFNGADYAYMDAAGTFVRAPVYGTTDGFEAADTIIANTHCKLTSTPGTQSAIKLNTLNLSGSGVGFSLNSGETLTLANNGLLKSGGGTVGTISGGTLKMSNTASLKELVIRTDSTNDSLTISSVIGPGATPTATITTTSAIVPVNSTNGLVVGMAFRSKGGSNNQTIASLDSATQITLSGTPGGSAGAQQVWCGYTTDALTKSGAGTLTLSGANMFGGGVNLNAGQLNINSTTALGPGFANSGTTIGRFTINEGTTIDNTSGAPITMAYKHPMTWNGSFTFVGSSDLFFPDPDGNGNITIPNDITITTQTKDITLRTQSNFAQKASRLTKNGPGTMQIGSNGGNGLNGGLAINEGVFAGYWSAGGQPFQVFAGPVDLGDITPGNSRTAILNIDQSSIHAAPITVRAGSSGILAIVCQNTQSLNGPMELNNAVTLANNSGGDINYYGVISGSGSLNIGNTGSYVIFGASKNLTHTGNVTLWRTNTYSGSTYVNSGTLKLGAQASINSSPTVSIAAGATLDVTQIVDFTLSSSTTLAAKGTGTATGTTAARIQGASGTAVNLGSRPINLTFTPTSGSGDTTHPSLLISQGNLALSGNTISVVNNGPTLGAGVYRLIQVTSATTTGVPNTAPVVVTGTGGLAPYSTALATVSSGNVILTVTTKLATSFSGLTLSQTIQEGTTSVTLSGTNSAAGPTYPANGETVRIAINGVTNSTTFTTEGAFSYVFPTAALTTGGSPYTISYLYEGNASLWMSSDTNTLLTVTTTTVPHIVAWPTATGITYGDALNASSLSGGSATNAAGASVPGVFTFTTDSTIPSVAGTYPASGTFTPDDPGYAVVVAPGAINVAVGTKTLTIDSPAVTTKTYTGTPGAVITGTLNGVVAGDTGTEISLVGTGTFDSSGVANGIGVTSTSTLTGTKASSYTLTQPTGLSGNITPATLTIRAENKSRLLGAANPPLTPVISGYQNGEDAAAIGLSGAPELSTAAVPASPEGNYTITCAAGTLTITSLNYTLTYVNGTLRVTELTTWAKGNGAWDIDTSLNWTNAVLGALTYVEGSKVQFNDTPPVNGPYTVTLNTVVHPTSVTVSNTVKDYTFSGTGSIGGTAALTKSGSGTLTISTANAYSGGTFVNAGAVTLDNQTGLGSGPVSLANGTVFQQSSFEGHNAGGALPNAFVLSGGSVTFNIPFSAYKDIWLTNTVSGAGAMVIQGGERAMTLTASNTLSGGVVLKDVNNKLQIYNAHAIGTGTLRSECTTEGIGTARLVSQVNLSAGSGVPNTLDIPAGSYLGVNADGANHLLLSGNITNAGGLYKTGSATLTLSGVNTYTGSYTGRTSVVQGILSLSNKNALGIRTELAITNSVVNLNYSGMMYISALKVNGVLQPIGIYSASNLPTYLTGGGLLNTGKPTPGTVLTIR